MHKIVNINTHSNIFDSTEHPVLVLFVPLVLFDHMYFPNNQCCYFLLSFVNAVLCLEVTSWVTTKIDIQSFGRLAAALFSVRRLVEME